MNRGFGVGSSVFGFSWCEARAGRSVIVDPKRRASPSTSAQSRYVFS